MARRRCVFVAGSRIEMHENKLLCRVKGMRMILSLPTFSFRLIFFALAPLRKSREKLFFVRLFLRSPAKFNIFLSLMCLMQDSFR